MKKNRFISSEYINVREKKVESIIKLVTIILYVILILNLFFLKINMDKIDSYEMHKKENKSLIKKESKKEIVAIEKFNDLTKNLNLDNFHIKFININEDSIELEIFIEGKKNYINVVKTIENKYSIKYLSPIIYEKEKKYFKVVL
ncbi:hypothetical protein U732_1564 [Clostridium argentinense CDC 2741]|uniref:Fimbrial assembly family protein n=1 Tax=Clostridium argentinense CDC 2741 TaxID=1418104 RepID=A0A0C1UIY9_9CLOT|nr:hypothetical protein [Clostridium argentinense]ARC85245.1 hypothetical protein RSJ17_12425 [Clostridium argentinense]KIE47255.1 hypothetical protein U732_1564 [Clostridium argentinense CDC 2741]NFF39449.1 hypothetical protein [Clostridium argentinense]NFP51004.1 hypothetical protein [Clostridium argentinense]NFP73602.1 hypothetical protein [Clostridium argentinense]